MRFISLFLVAVLVNLAAGALMSLRLLEDVNSVCNDGSPAAYYFRPGQGESRNKWVIFLEGGGLCFGPASCAGRSKYISSSHKLAPAKAGQFPVSHKPEDNPRFYDYNHVFIHYCSSDFWTGTSTYSNTVVKGFFFSGWNIVRSVIGELSFPINSSDPSLRDATEILFGGESAGGIGALNHVNYVAQQFPKAQVRSFVSAGWFVTEPDVQSFNGAAGCHPADHATSWKTVFQRGYELWQSKVDDACEKENSDQPWRCFNGFHIYPSIKVPLYIAENKWDYLQLSDWLCLPTVRFVTRIPFPNLAYIQSWSQTLTHQLMSTVGIKEGDGMFVPSCLDHPVNPNTVVSNHTLLEALTWWYDGISHVQGRGSIRFDLCEEVHCNPTCTKLYDDHDWNLMSHSQVRGNPKHPRAGSSVLATNQKPQSSLPNAGEVRRRHERGEARGGEK